MNDLSKRALEIAIGQIGQQEKPLKSNWGRPVQDYLASVGIFFPASWCMAFVYYCFDQAASQLGLVNPLAKTGGVLPQWNSRQGQQIPVGLNAAQPGDIIIFDHGHGLGHTGIVELVEDGNLIDTVEGNTNDTGSREGIEVCRKVRKMTDPQLKGFLRF